MAASLTHRLAMFAIIEKWQQGGLSQKTFCEQHQVIPHVFHYWYKCYRGQHGPASSTTVSDSTELKLPAPSAEAAVELLLSCGHRIMFHQPVTASFIKALIN